MPHLRAVCRRLAPPVAIAALMALVAFTLPVGGLRIAATTSTTLPIAITTSSLPNAAVGSSYSATLVASGGTPPYTWSTASGPVPPGLVLSSLGSLSGRPGNAGTTSIALRVTDSLGAVASKTISLVITGPVPVPEELIAAAATGSSALATAGGTTVLTPATDTAVSAVALSPDGAGVYLVTKAGQVMTSGDAVYEGELSRSVGSPIVGIALDPFGKGYWLVNAKGRVFGFGSAHKHGSLNSGSGERVVGIAPAPSGEGYWLASSGGKVTAFGRAASVGSVRQGRLHHDRVVAIAPSAAGGYVLASLEGRIFTFGPARNAHLPGRISTLGPIAGIAAAPNGVGFFVVSESGGVAALGSARTINSITGLSGVVAIAAGS